MPAGRPSDYSQGTADAVCALLAEGQSLRTVCQQPGMPGKTTVFRWLRDHSEFRDQYARAKEQAVDALVEEIVDIADDGSNDWMEIHRGDDVAWKENGEALQRSRLRVDTRKWIASKLKPKKYGDKLDLNHAGIPTAPATITIKTA